MLAVWSSLIDANRKQFDELNSMYASIHDAVDAEYIFFVDALHTSTSAIDLLFKQRLCIYFMFIFIRLRTFVPDSKARTSKIIVSNILLYYYFIIN